MTFYGPMIRCPFLSEPVTQRFDFPKCFPTLLTSIGETGRLEVANIIYSLINLLLHEKLARANIWPSPSLGWVRLQ